MKYYSLTDLLDKGIDIEPIIDEILFITISAKENYPNYAEWFLFKHVPGIYTHERNTIIAVDNNSIVGVSNIKIDENKLSTLYFDPRYRYHGLGINLVEESLKYLRNSRPLITMPTTYLPQFKNIIKRYDWQLTDAVSAIYQPNETELIFNGSLESDKSLLTNDERLILTYKQTKDKNILKLLKNPLVLFKLNPNIKKMFKKVKKVLPY